MTNTEPQDIQKENPNGPVRPIVAGQDVVVSSISKKSPMKGAPFVITVVLLLLILVAGIGAFAADDDGSVSNAGAGDTVAVIDLVGTIQYDGSACSPDGFKSLLDEAEASDDVKAVVLRVNSGGGVATAGEEMTTYLKDFSKPVVVSSASMNASAAYEISSQADYIFTANTTEIGAIGTAREFVDYSDLMDMLGIGIDVIVSADSKDSTYGYRELTEEERAHYQQMIDECNSIFIANVADGRNVSLEQASEWANGLTWTGMTAVKMGIADEIGTLEDACDKAAELGGCADNYVTSSLYIEYSGLPSLLDLFTYSSSTGSSPVGDAAIAMKELKSDVSIVQ